jgi:lipid II:glycine glycyltransferase (peptidoglycan interpeptide bridge formation enzyme)
MVKKITTEQKNEFNKKAIHPLQTWEWGEFRKKTGNKVVRLGVYKGKKLTDSIQVVFSIVPKTGLKIGTVIRGPLPTHQILDSLKNLAKQENAIFIKLEPFAVKKAINNTKLQISNYSSIRHLLKENNCIKGKTLFTPTSFWIDLTRSEKELMKGFHSKTRYNVRYAKRKGVQVVEDNSNEAFEKYISLTRETVERQGFYAHSEKYHRIMWKYLHQLPITNHQTPIARLLTARYKNKILTTWIVFSWKNFLYYPYGASTNRYKNLQANSLMMWEAIKYGKKLGLKTFDLWGREEGKGFTRFKEGFNPQVVESLGTWDLVTSPLYYMYRPVEFIRWNFLRLRGKFSMPHF